MHSYLIKVNEIMLGKLTEYLDKILGLKLVIHNENQPPINIPSIYRHSFFIRMVSIEDISALILEPREKSIELPTLISRVENFEAKIGIPCILLIDKIDSISRRQFVSKRRSFIVPDRQVYLPFIGTCFSERGLSARKEQGSLSPSAQLLILYHLQKETLEGISFGSISDKLGYSLKTVSLIATELKDLDICQHIHLDSKTKSLEFKSKDKRQLWNNVLPYLSSPIHKVVYTYPEDAENLERYSCYDNALAHYTDIIGSSQRCYAVDKRSISVNSIGIKSDLNFIGAVRLELWKYNPSILAENGIIDPLSMCLCYKDDDNERVLGEINKLVDKIL